MIFIDQGKGGLTRCFFFAGESFLSEGGFDQRGVFAGGGFWQEGGYGRRGVLSGGGFCPVAIDSNGGYTKY